MRIMKKTLFLISASVVALGAVSVAGSTRTSVPSMEAYINIPGEKAVRVMNPKITFGDAGLMSVETPWGTVYTTHPANIVIITQKWKTSSF